jgi:hypothetical protein
MSATQSQPPTPLLVRIVAAAAHTMVAVDVTSNGTSVTDCAVSPSRNTLAVRDAFGH